jgi:hypothetical protein
MAAGRVVPLWASGTRSVRPNLRARRVAGFRQRARWGHAFGNYFRDYCGLALYNRLHGIGPQTPRLLARIGLQLLHVAHRRIHDAGYYGKRSGNWQRRLWKACLPIYYGRWVHV